MRSVKAIGALTLLSSTVLWNTAQAATHMFNIPASTVPEALAAFQKQSGVGVIAKGADVQKILVSPVHGIMDDQAALQKLLAQTPLQVRILNKSSTLIVVRKPDPNTRKAGIGGLESVTVTTARGIIGHKKVSPAVLDSIRYDPITTLGGASSVAQQLILLPGVTGVRDADEPRYVALRGISPDLSQTTIDGLTMASLGESGSAGSRRVNLQLVPSDMTSRTDIYKSFNAEQDAGAIGGIVDMIPLSAFDHKGFYTFLDGAAAYNTYGGISGHNGQSRYNDNRHLGESAKGTISDTFGKNHEFGIVVSGRYQVRTRNSTKHWQDFNYLDNDGNSVKAPTSPAWNGLIAPANYQNGNFANYITNAGGTGRFEWRPAEGNLYAALTGWSYLREENSTMNQVIYNVASQTENQTASSGRQKITSISTRNREDQWRRQNSGIQGHIDWKEGLSALKIRLGYTWETYDNDEPYLQALANPQNEYLNYTGGPSVGNLSNVASFDNPSFMNSIPYTLSLAQRQKDRGWEGLPTARVDYGWNTGSSARGFGVAAGFEWRQLDLDFDREQTNYGNGQNMNAWLLANGYTPWQANYTAPVLAGHEFPWNSLTPNSVSSLYSSRSADYKYREDVYDGYVSLHYSLKNTTFIAGVRVDDVSYKAWSPSIQNGVASSDFSSHPGSYRYPLPSFDVVHRFPYDIHLHASYSERLGRPTPSNIAQAQSVTCGQSSGTGTDCTISEGNPNLKPRRAHNFDFSVDKYFDHNHGLISVAFFSKWIRDDIYSLQSIQNINGTDYTVSRPENASSSNVKGLEFSVSENNIHFLGQNFDLSANASWMDGHMSYASGTQTFHANGLLYQPKVLVNGSATWRIPQIGGGLQVTANYSGKYLTGLGSQPYLNTGYGSLFTLNLGFWHKVYDHVIFKYEVMNLANQQPVFLRGDHLQYIDEKDNYGRAAFFHVVVDNL